MIQTKAKEIVAALGGKNNIKSIEACITRLRIELKDSSKLETEKIKKLGAHWVTNLGGGAVQIIWGTYANLMESAIKEAIKND